MWTKEAIRAEERRLARRTRSRERERERRKEEEGCRYRNTILLVELELLMNDLVWFRHNSASSAVSRVSFDARMRECTSCCGCVLIVFFTRRLTRVYIRDPAWISQQETRSVSFVTENVSAINVAKYRCCVSPTATSSWLFFLLQPLWLRPKSNNT